MMGKKIHVFSIAVICMIMTLTAFKNFVLADCNHVWVLDYSECLSENDTQHVCISYYYCKYCEKEKTEEVYEDHKWKLEYTECGEGNDKQHINYYYYYCEKCEEGNLEKVYEDHAWESEYSECGKGNDKQHINYYYYFCEKCEEEKVEKVYEDHEWELDFTECEKSNKKQHISVSYYTCKKCEEEKTEKKPEKHKWNLIDTDYKNATSKGHTEIKYYECKECETTKKETLKVKHKYDSYKICKNCDYAKPGTIVLKEGKTGKVNEKTWVKIKVKKNGYLIVKTNQKDSWSLYNSKKKNYPHFYCGNTGTIYIPVKKGTYYLYQKDAYDTSRATIQYTFKKVPSPKNFTIKTAEVLKRGKTTAGTIYSSLKPKTWTRYYKVALTKKQYLKVKSELYCDVYDADGNYVDMVSDYNKAGDYKGQISGNKLEKGVYYIMVSYYWYSEKERSYTPGVYYTIKWS